MQGQERGSWSTERARKSSRSQESAGLPVLSDCRLPSSDRRLPEAQMLAVEAWTGPQDSAEHRMPAGGSGGDGWDALERGGELRLLEGNVGQAAVEEQEEDLGSDSESDGAEREMPIVWRPYRVIGLTCAREECLVRLRWRVKAGVCATNSGRQEGEMVVQTRLESLKEGVQDGLGPGSSFQLIEEDNPRALSCICVEEFGEEKIKEFIKVVRSGEGERLSSPEDPPEQIIKILKSFKNSLRIRYFNNFQAHLTRKLHGSPLQQGILEMEIVVCPSKRSKPVIISQNQKSVSSNIDDSHLPKSVSIVNPLIGKLSIIEDDDTSNGSMQSSSTSNFDDSVSISTIPKGFHSGKNQKEALPTRYGNLTQSVAPSARLVSSKNLSKFSAEPEAPPLISPLSTISPLVSMQTHIHHRTTYLHFIQVWSRSPRILLEFKANPRPATQVKSSLRASHTLKIDLARVHILSYPSSKVLLKQSIVRQRINAVGPTDLHADGLGNSDDEINGDDEDGFANLPRFHVEEDETPPRYYTLYLSASHERASSDSDRPNSRTNPMLSEEFEGPNDCPKAQTTPEQIVKIGSNPPKTASKKHVSISAYTCVEDCSFLNGSSDNFSVLRVCDFVRRRVVSVQVPNTIVEDFVVSTSHVFVCGRTTAEKLWLEARDVFGRKGLEKSIMPYFLWVIEKYQVRLHEQNGLVFTQVLQILEPSFKAKQESNYLHKIAVIDSELVCLRANGLNQTAVMKSFDTDHLRQLSGMEGILDHRISTNLQKDYEITEIDMQRGLLRMKSLHMARTTPGEKNLPVSIQLKPHPL